MNQIHNKNATIAGLLTVFIWGASALLVVHLQRLPALELTALTWIISFFFMLFFYMAKKEPVLQHFKRPLKDYLLVAGGMGVYTALFYMAFKYAPPFEANTLNYLWPIFLMFFLTLFRGAPMTLMKSIGMVLGFAGCILLSASHEGPVFAGLNIGHILMIAAAIIWALYSCFTQGQDHPAAFMIPVFLACAVFTFVLHVLFETTVTPNPVEWIFIVSIALCRLAYALWDYAMRYGNQMLVTSASYFTPLISTLVMAAGGYGAASPAIAVSAGLIIAGCVVVNGDRIKKLFARR